MESSQALLVASEYAFDDSVWIEPWPGHTPGHLCVIARSLQGSVILSGDIMHTARQCAEPHLNSCFCVDREAATGGPRAVRLLDHQPLAEDGGAQRKRSLDLELIAGRSSRAGCRVINPVTIDSKGPG